MLKRRIRRSPGDAAPPDERCQSFLGALQEAKEAAEERTRELAALLEISGVVSSTLELRPLLSLVLDRLKTVTDHSGAAITVFDDDETPVILDYRGPPLGEHLRPLRRDHLVHQPRGGPGRQLHLAGRNRCAWCTASRPSAASPTTSSSGSSSRKVRSPCRTTS